MLPIVAPRSRRLSFLLVACGLAAFASAVVAVTVLALPGAPRGEPRTITVPVPIAVPTAAVRAAPRPCLPGRADWSERPRAAMGSSYQGKPWVWFEVVQDCRGQVLTLAATDRVRLVIADGADVRVVELPELAVPRAIDHFAWDGTIDLVVGKHWIAVVGNDPVSRHHRAMVSADGGWTWTTQALDWPLRHPRGPVRMSPDGTLEWARPMRR